MTVAQIVGTWMQFVGAVVALASLVVTYVSYAPKGTLKRTVLSIYWWTREHVQRGWKRPVKLRFSHLSGGGPEADLRSYDIPDDTREALELLASYIREDRARIADAKNESSHTAERVDWIEENQDRVVEQGVREYALGGLWFVALGLLISAIGIFLTLF